MTNQETMTELRTTNSALCTSNCTSNTIMAAHVMLASSVYK